MAHRDELRARLLATAYDAGADVAYEDRGDDGETWVIDQVVRLLTGSAYDGFVTWARAGEDGPDTYEWDTGTAP